MRNKIENWIYRLAIKVIARRIVLKENLLTPKHLENNGWIKEGESWVEPNIKERDKIWIDFEHHYFRIYHGKDKTFIGLESKIEWFEMYYLLAHGENGRYELAGI
ncbi:MAG: hypothetical protein ACI8Q1_000273 [Parvicella sp.]|jgi:hypothetical protein